MLRLGDESCAIISGEADARRDLRVGDGESGRVIRLALGICGRGGGSGLSVARSESG